MMNARMAMLRSAGCAAVMAGVLLVAAVLAPVKAADPPSLAFLGAYLQNDNEGLEPTTAAERARLVRIGEEFQQQLGDSGQFRLVQPDAAVEKQLAAATQTPGECGGCEIDYGRELGADIVAWLRVQKVSNLILNMNVYVADVKSGKALLIRSVDVRGNTDESWSRSLRYLVKNYVLPAGLKPSGS